MAEKSEYSPHERSEEGKIKAKIDAVQKNFEFVQNSLISERLSEKEIILLNDAKIQAIDSLVRLLEFVKPEKRQGILNNITTHANNFLRVPGTNRTQITEMVNFLQENGIPVKTPNPEDVNHYDTTEIIGENNVSE